MAKVDWITWKTESKDIIDSEKILEEINNKIAKYNTYTDLIINEGLQYEIGQGGLTEDALILNGVSPAHEKALEIMNNLEEIQNLIHSLNNKIKTSVEDQRQIEKQQLIEAIQTKIEEEEKVKNNTVSFNNKLQTKNPIIDKTAVEDIIETTNQRINQLKEKLEIVKAM